MARTEEDFNRFGLLSGGRGAYDSRKNDLTFSQQGGALGAGNKIFNEFSKGAKNIANASTNLGRNALDIGGQFLQGSNYNQLGGNTQSVSPPALGSSPTQPVSLVSAVNQNGNIPVLGSAIKNQPASTEAPGSYQTDKYRDASIYQTPELDILNRKPGDESEGDRLGVSFGGGKGSVSGLTPEQAQRIQASLANGDQVTGWEPGALAQAEHSSGNASIMSALQSGQIGAEQASALMSRDFRASDRMDRLGGNAGTYQQPGQTPTNPVEGMAYGTDINNFTQNGQLNNKEALLAQRSYLNSLGGLRGVANAERPQFQNVSKDIYDNQGQGMKVGQDLYSFNPQTGKYTPFNQSNSNPQGDLFNKIMSSKTEKTKKLGITKFEKINGEGSFEKYLKTLER